jgi:fatty acid desaturase
MQELRILLKTFIYVLACSMISAAVFITIFNPKETFDIMLLWEVILMAVIASLGSVLFFSKKEISKEQMRIRKIIHYIYINIVVVGTAILCRWIHVSKLLQLMVMLILIALVYTIVCAVMFYKEEKTAEWMNEQLRKKYPEE